MEVNNRFRKQSLNFEQIDEKLNYSAEIAVGWWPDAAHDQQRFAEAENGHASEGREGPCNRLCGKNQEAAVCRGWRKGWVEVKTNGPVHPAEASEQAAEGEIGPNRDDCPVIHLRNGLPDRPRSPAATSEHQGARRCKPYWRQKCGTAKQDPLCRGWLRREHRRLRQHILKIL